MLTLTNATLPRSIRQLPQPPKQLFLEGVELERWVDAPKVAVVGSRKYSAYGRLVTEQLVSGLVREGVAIISGLALGIDAIAHEAALAGGGCTIAVLPGPIEHIYPARHRGLAERIKRQGSLMTEYPPGARLYKHSFVARNRLIAGIADAVLIPEAGLKSGSLHTARFALEQGIPVLSVPGAITSPSSQGTNNLIKSGAIPVTDIDDILLAIGYERRSTRSNPDYRQPLEGSERLVYGLIQAGAHDQSILMTSAALSAGELNQILTALEINGYIAPLGNGRWAAR